MKYDIVDFRDRLKRHVLIEDNMDIELVSKGIKNSHKLLQFLYQKVYQLNHDIKYTAYSWYFSDSQQKPLIEQFTNNSEFVLVVLDACRYDIFQSVINNFLSGELQNVWASARWTAEYARRTWTGKYQLTYLSSMPVVSDFYFDLCGIDYRPTNHIETLVPLWDCLWDPERGSVPADRVTDAALTYAANTDEVRLVVHYAQPHAPFIGKTEILPWDNSSELDMRDLLENDIDRPNQRIYMKINNGEISEERLRQAYTDNLEYVLGEVVRLVRRLDCPVVVTGDHGEHLGEKGRYLHEEDSLLIRQVPWFFVDDIEIGQHPIEDAYQEKEVRSAGHRKTPEEIQSRLADLGYIE